MCQKCGQPLEPWEAGLCEGCGRMREIIETALGEINALQKALADARGETRSANLIAMMLEDYLKSPHIPPLQKRGE